MGAELGGVFGWVHPTKITDSTVMSVSSINIDKAFFIFMTTPFGSKLEFVRFLIGIQVAV